MDVIQLAFSIPLGYIDMVNSMPQPEYNKIIDSMRQVLSDALAEYTEKSKENSKNG